MTAATEQNASPRPPDEPSETRAIAQRSGAARWLGTTGAWVLLVDVVLFVVFGLASNGGVFFSGQNAQALMLDGTEGLLLALGLSMLLGAGIFDLSLGANLVLSSVISALVIQKIAGAGASGNYHDVGLAVIVGLLVCLAAGALYGLVNGLIIAYLDVNSLIATLGTMGIGTGTALLITHGGDISGLPPVMQGQFGLRTVATIPLPALVAIALTVVFWAVVRYLRYGTRTMAMGSSRPAAQQAGLRIRPHLVSLTMLAGLMAGLAGFVDISRYASTSTAGHPNDALAAFTAAVIGGTLLEGGRINILGTLWGAALAVILESGLVVLGVASFWQLIAIGAVLIVAVAIDRIRYRRRASQ